MSKMSGIRKPTSAGSVVSTRETGALNREGFTQQEIARLVSTRDRFQSGDLNEWTEDYKRLLFARWLYEHGQLES